MQDELFEELMTSCEEMVAMENEDCLQLTPFQLEERQLYLDGVKLTKGLPPCNLQEEREASYHILQDSLGKIARGEDLEFVEE